MSQKASPQKTMTGREIPNRRIADISNLPSDYSTTPGGSIFSTTPGGTRIFYERSFLMKCRESPLAKTPPANMANIPGVTSPVQADAKENGVEDPKPTIVEKVNEENPQFEMDI